MNLSSPPPTWRFRLMIATGLAVYVLVILFLRARSATVAVEDARTEMIRELQQLAVAQEEHFQTTGSYAATIGPPLRYTPPSTLLLSLHAEGGLGWRGVIGDSSLAVSPRACGIFEGEARLAPNRATTAPGVVACW